MENKNIKQPATAFASPRFCNTGNFMRMERVNSAEGLDFAIFMEYHLTQQLLIAQELVLVPQGIRNISVMMKTNNPIQGG